MSAPPRVPLSEPLLGEAEARYLSQCISDNWVSAEGRFVHEFESHFATLHGRDDAVSTNSGTAALHLALLALDIGPGDEVIVPALTFVATANVVRYVGATPVFVDADPMTYALSPTEIEAAITTRTKAILAVHLFGHPADMAAIAAIAANHRLAVVEDATEALGSRFDGQLCGTFGDIGCFSFNGNKLITTGGGGMVLSRDPSALRRVRHLSFQARVSGSREYVHDEVGFNYALSNLHAAVGIAQLERLDEFVSHRRFLSRRYAEGLRDAPGLSFSEEVPPAESNYWLMSVLVDDEVHGRTRDDLLAALGQAQIEARPFFKPIPHLLPYTSAVSPLYPISTRLHKQGVSIPSSMSLDTTQQDRVIAVLKGSDVRSSSQP